jgi:hypothetical protein
VNPLSDGVLALQDVLCGTWRLEYLGHDGVLLVESSVVDGSRPTEPRAVADVVDRRRC